MPGSEEFNYVYALRTNDGSLLWRDQLTHVHHAISGLNVLTSLALLNSTLYVGEAEEVPGGGTVTVYALRASDGKVTWRYDIANTGITDVEMLVADGMVYVGQAETTVLALRPNDGTPLWRYKLSQNEGGALKLVRGNGVVYVGIYPDLGSGHSVCALQGSTGTKLWCHVADAGVILVQAGS